MKQITQSTARVIEAINMQRKPLLRIVNRKSLPVGGHMYHAKLHELMALNVALHCLQNVKAEFAVA
jgi:hypothetical protein